MAWRRVGWGQRAAHGTALVCVVQLTVSTCFTLQDASDVAPARRKRNPEQLKDDECV